MTGAEVIEFIKTVGVPAGIAFFVLWKMDGRLEEFIKEFREFRETVRDSLVGMKDLKDHISETGDRVIREVGHDVRGALGNFRIKDREP